MQFLLTLKHEIIIRRILMSAKEKTSYSDEIAEEQHEQKRLILFNDDYNTFDFVIQSLIDVCKHDEMQAENCALIAHYKGKCPIKNGSYEELKSYYSEMTNRKLSVEIK